MLGRELAVFSGARTAVCGGDGRGSGSPSTCMEKPGCVSVTGVQPSACRDCHEPSAVHALPRRRRLRAGPSLLPSGAPGLLPDFVAAGRGAVHSAELRADRCRCSCFSGAFAPQDYEGPADVTVRSIPVLSMSQP